MNTHISIDDMMSAVGCLKQNLLLNAQEAKTKAEQSSSEEKYAWNHLAEAHNQNALKMEELLKKLDSIHEAGYDFIGGVGERE